MSAAMVDLVVQKTLTSAARVFSLDIAVRSDSRRVVLYGPSGAGKSLTLRAIAGFEPVTVGVSAGQYENANLQLSHPGIRVIELSSDDAWVRDTGPTFVTNGQGGVRGVDWTFNAWGGFNGGLGEWHGDMNPFADEGIIHGGMCADGDAWHRGLLLGIVQNGLVLNAYVTRLETLHGLDEVDCFIGVKLIPWTPSPVTRSSRLLNDKYSMRRSNLFSLPLLAQEDWSQRGFRRRYWVTRAPQCNRSFTGLSTGSTSTRSTGWPPSPRSPPACRCPRGACRGRPR